MYYYVPLYVVRCVYIQLPQKGNLPNISIANGDYEINLINSICFHNTGLVAIINILAAQSPVPRLDVGSVYIHRVVVV